MVPFIAVCIGISVLLLRERTNTDLEAIIQAVYINQKLNLSLIF